MKKLSIRVRGEDQHRIILTPYAEISAREKWLFENPEAMHMLKQGLADSVAGRIVKRKKQ